MILIEMVVCCLHSLWNFEFRAMYTYKRTRSGRVDYFRLHNLSSAVLFESKPRKIKTYRKKFEVERIVTKRKAVTVSRSSFCSNLSFHFKIHNHVLTMYLLF